MSDDQTYPLRKRTAERIPQSFSVQVTNILSNTHVYEITGTYKKRREQLGLIQVARNEEAAKQIQKISGSINAEELVVTREIKLLNDVAQLEGIWSSLSGMVIELGNMGVDVTDAVSTLRSVKSLINLYSDQVSKNACATGEIGAQIRNDMRTLEDKLMVNIANKLGNEYANEWSARMKAAWHSKEVEKAVEQKVERKSVHAAPRMTYWVC